jgi:hypothetical protein
MNFRIMKTSRGFEIVLRIPGMNHMLSWDEAMQLRSELNTCLDFIEENGSENMIKEDK